MPLRYMFIDMNAFFASVEQQDNPALRGQPVAVVAADADTTSCIAASYEAKAKGIRTGTPVWEARKLCPNIQIRVGRHERYVEVHHELVRAVGRCIPVTRVMSVDEMACRLIGAEQRPDKATSIARAIKDEIRHQFDYLRCSIGVGPNVMLAKVAGDLMKPDGLTFLPTEELETRLRLLKLTDFPGIGPRMEQRFHRQGIYTVDHLLRLSPAQMCHVWGSRVHGWRWWYLLRGEDVPDKPTKRRTVGHSHILPPEYRNEVKAKGVMMRLVHKAAARMRRINYWAGGIVVGVSYQAGESWYEARKLSHCQDTLTICRIVDELWRTKPPGRPLKVSVTLTDLVAARVATPSLFDHDRRLIDLCHIMDRLNRLFGPNTIYFGSQFDTPDSAPMRIPFSHVPLPDPAVHGISKKKYAAILV
jgi:DNA polymerase IV